MPVVPCREDLARFAEMLFVKTGNAVEVGTYQGGFAEYNLQHWNGTYYAVDAWSYRPGDGPDKNYEKEGINDANYERTRTRTNRFGSRVHLVRSLSVDAAHNFSDGFFDWVFIDALHTREALLADLRAWWPKLRAGGLMSGDDFGDRHLPPLAKPHFLQKGVAEMGEAEDKNPFFWRIPRDYDWGVMRATSEFAKEQGAVLHVGWLTGKGRLEDSKATCYTWNAWYIVKPYADKRAASLASHVHTTAKQGLRGDPGPLL